MLAVDSSRARRHRTYRNTARGITDATAGGLILAAQHAAPRFATHARSARGDIGLVKRAGTRALLPDGGSRRGDNLCVLDRVDELPEARQLAVADIPDVRGGHVERLSCRFAGARVADDRDHGVRRIL